jgi:anti-anti-sigma regulatory factor
VNRADRILATRLGPAVWVRVRGRGSFQNSPDLKAFADASITRGDRTFVIDLEDCTGMDSTFMGTITGIALTLAQTGGGGAVHVLNAIQRNRQLLENLGLDQVLTLDTEGTSFQTERAAARAAAGADSTRIDPVSISREERAQHVLAAHEALGAANAHNLPRFRDVVEFFRRDLESEAPS